MATPPLCAMSKSHARCNGALVFTLLLGSLLCGQTTPGYAQADPYADRPGGVGAHILAMELGPWTAAALPACQGGQLALQTPKKWNATVLANTVLFAPEPNPYDIAVFLICLGQQHDAPTLQETLARLTQQLSPAAEVVASEITVGPALWPAELASFAAPFPSQRPGRFLALLVRTPQGAFFLLAGAAEDIYAPYEPILREVLLSFRIHKP